MANANSYTLRDGLGMLEAIIGTDGKAMSRKARQACREIIADMRSQSPDDSFRGFNMTEGQILKYAVKRFNEIHPGSMKPTGRSVPKSARV
jgi:hypothetical protein